jgi:uncharacterized protein YdaU (DUF1376 family)
MKFYKRDPDRALAGMNELTLKQRGAYNSLLDLLYSRDGDVPDDDQRVAKMIACHWREWKAVKEELIALGKVWSEGGKLRAKRVQETLKEASDFSQEQSRKASEGWVKRKNDNKNNDTVMPSGNALTPTATPTATPRSPSSEGLAPLLEEAFDLWNLLAEEGPVKLAKAQLLTTARKAKLGQRLAESGGLDGWKAALDKVRQSSFCHGDNDRGWVADFDFLMQQSSFTRLMEGKYDNRPTRINGHRKNSLDDTFAVIDAVLDEAKRREAGGGDEDREAPARELP